MGLRPHARFARAWSSAMINQLDQPMLYPCNIMSIIVFVGITESAKIKLTVKWYNH